MSTRSFGCRRPPLATDAELIGLSVAQAATCSASDRQSRVLVLAAGERFIPHLVKTPDRHVDGSSGRHFLGPVEECHPSDSRHAKGGQRKVADQARIPRLATSIHKNSTRQSSTTDMWSSPVPLLPLVWGRHCSTVHRAQPMGIQSRARLSQLYSASLPLASPRIA